MSNDIFLNELINNQKVIYKPQGRYNLGAMIVWIENNELICIFYDEPSNSIKEFSHLKDYNLNSLNNFIPQILPEYLCSFKDLKTNLLFQNIFKAFHKLISLKDELKTNGMFEFSPKSWICNLPQIGLITLITVYEKPFVKQIDSFIETDWISSIYKEPSKEINSYNTEWDSIIIPFKNWFEEYMNKLKSGKFALYYNHSYTDESNYIVYFDNKWIEIPVKNEKIILEKIWNPFILLISEKEMFENLTNELYFNSNYVSPRYILKEFSASHLSDIDLVTTNLMKTKSEMVNLYIEKIKNGMNISGGPTTDQRWMIYYEKGKFMNEYFEYKGDELIKINKPIEELEVRKIISTYKMFGLSEIKDY